jgi:hypothetical protein
LSGRFTTSQIVEALRVSDGTVKSVCRDKARGGLMPKNRAFMTRGERQELLSYLRHYRLDGGLFNRGDVFTAVKVKGELEEPTEVPDPKSKAGKKALRELAHEAQLLRTVELRESVEDLDGHFPKRGPDAYPLEWLYKERLLRDPENISFQKHQTDSEEMRRHEAGLRLRRYLEEAQLGGFKEINLERAGGSSRGVSIPERFVAARSAVESIQQMMAKGDYGRIVAVVHHDDFIWDMAADRESRKVILETIRRALDTVSLFIGMMEEKAFENRWKFIPEVYRQRSREDVREAVVTARDIIRSGERN